MRDSVIHMCQHFQSYFVSDFLHSSFSFSIYFSCTYYNLNILNLNGNACDDWIASFTNLFSCCLKFEIHFLLFVVLIEQLHRQMAQAFISFLNNFGVQRSVIRRSTNPRTKSQNSEFQIPNATISFDKNLLCDIWNLKSNIFNGNVWEKTATNTNVQCSWKKNPILCFPFGRNYENKRKNKSMDAEI